MRFYDSKDIFTMRKPVLNYHLKSPWGFFYFIPRICKLMLEVHKTWFMDISDWVFTQFLSWVGGEVWWPSLSSLFTNFKLKTWLIFMHLSSLPQLPSRIAKETRWEGTQILKLRELTMKDEFTELLLVDLPLKLAPTIWAVLMICFSSDEGGKII